MANQPASKRRGHIPSYVMYAGRPVVGLSQTAADGRYYTTHAKRRKWFGKDLQRALVDFREWEAKQRPESISILDTSSGPNADTESNIFFCNADGTYSKVRQIGDVAFWAAVREAIIADPVLAAQRTGLPLDRLHQFQARDANSIPLVKLLDQYIHKTPPITAKYAADASRHWTEFQKVVGVDTVGALDATAFRNYRDYVYRNGTGLSHRYANNRFGAIGIVLAHGLSEGVDTVNIQNALGLCKMLRRLQGTEFKPNPISRNDYQKLLAGANVRLKAILLTALNCAMYPTDICDLKKVDLDLDAGVLCNRRTKNGVPRIAVLWQQTVKAIKAYLAVEKLESESVFSCSSGPFTVGNLRCHYVRLRKSVDVTAEFASIRDGAQTAAIENGADPIHVDMLLGHRASGVRDNYLMRRPGMVADACKAIEAYYF